MACIKSGYRSKAAAREASKEALKRIRSGRKGGGGHAARLRPYQCPACGMWHLTSRKPDPWRS